MYLAFIILSLLLKILFNSHRSLIPIQVGFDECFARFSSCHFVTISVPLSQNKRRCPHHAHSPMIVTQVDLKPFGWTQQFMGQIMESTGLLGVSNITIYACSIHSTWLYIVVPWALCQIVSRFPFQQVVCCAIYIKKYLKAK
jgi:hypothetical protein